LTFVTGDPVWTDKNGLLEFTSHASCASCYVIPPFNNNLFSIELDYGDGKKQKVGLGSMFGFVGAFEHRFRNHTATVKIEKIVSPHPAKKESGDSSGSVDSSILYLYQIDLRKLRRLKDMSASASNELFTPKELLFINNFRKAAGEFSQLQDNMSLASVTEHGKVRVRMLSSNDPSVA
jgi:hypothetical protein